MPANRFNAFTDYRVGIGLRIPHYRHILERKPVVDWFEIISENYLVDGGRPLTVLDQILEQYRVVQLFPSFLYIAVLVYWIVAFWRPERERAPLSDEMKDYLVALHSRVQYDLQQVTRSRDRA